tara:strand:- start:1960 stop:2784 length:825 start_codon:yes stop_codon:yes gene_type:complete
VRVRFAIACAQELVERTGRNPQYVYLQIGCSKAAERRMLHYARTQCVGKPFSNIGMVRSLLWPRHTDNTSFFCAGAPPARACLDRFRACACLDRFRACARACAELVAAILREGGLMDQQSNPGSATPETLHRIYKDRAAVAANPFVLRDVQASHGITLSSTVGGVFPRTRVLADDAAERESLLQSRAILAPAVGCNGSTRRPKPTGAAAVPQQRRAGEKRGDSPPRARFKVISEGQRMPGAGSHHHHHHHNHHQAAAQTGMTLTLNSLDMSRRV